MGFLRKIIVWTSNLSSIFDLQIHGKRSDGYSGVLPCDAFDTGSWNQCPANDDGAAINQKENPKADHAKQTEQLVVEAEKADEVKDKEKETSVEQIPVSTNSEEPPNKRAKECSSNQ